MIDFHTHILPGIDDGSRDASMTEAMLAEERHQGVDIVAATPHFYADRMSVDHFLERRAAAYEKTEAIRAEHADGDALPALVCGAEVYYFRGIGRAEAVPELCIGGTKTLLLEMPFQEWDEEVLQDVKDLIRKQHLNIVLAHVERYIDFQKHRKIWDAVMDLPLTPQINAGSFYKKGGFLRPDKKRKFCMNFLREHPDLILGSDCHNMTSRKPNLAGAREEIRKALGDDALARIDAAAGKALA